MSSLTLIMLALVGLMVVGVAGSVLSARWYGRRAALPTPRREEPRGSDYQPRLPSPAGRGPHTWP